MEGVIPYLVHAIKKQKQKPHNSYICLSKGSTRSSHLLLNGTDSPEGSSHRRTWSDQFQWPTMESLEQRSGLEYARSCSVNNNSTTFTSMGYAPKIGSNFSHVRSR
ncbi:hypothetical protein I3843_06G158100 [Carya illinoinensis]|uniref:Uncharacterized protein n=1 Tax=Carya illinoinensis TaxID=32201 RepID=A0A8T1QCT5_CARIL|nr:hypothetical protein I3760_06G167200 [Carya illinoinensis]KAG6652175.1 hypothetical protein CIPAW_06G165600 [Carya illinoinensis]KAG6710104.1 hypothetical protein I3842_06G166800 [Carya illinoinensis]KAG7976596.1 hypothetical protein I3843_06G158100 [Carya illinoinensis]